MAAPDSTKLKLVQFNVENLFLYLDLWNGQNLKSMNETEWSKVSKSLTANKPLKKAWMIADVIKDIDADIVMLNEVGGEESLTNFARYFLDGAYEPYLKEGNSARGIDVGYLIKKRLEIKPVLISHKDRPIQFLYPHESQTPSGGKSHYFSRDVAELRLFRPTDTSPRLVILLTHLKSKLDPENIDPSGRLRRAAELKTLIGLYNDVKSELNAATPIVVAGDFNGVANGHQCEDEFRYLHEHSDLLEALEVCQKPAEERFTQVQVYNGRVQPIQIDYIFISPHLKDKVMADETGVYLFKNELGQTASLPRSMEERDRLPSDHYPLVLTLRSPF